MIHTPVLVSLREEFDRRTRQRELDVLDKERAFTDRQKRKDDRQADAAQDDLDIIMAVMATDTEIELALVEFDSLDTATVGALITNREAIEKAEEDVRIMLDRAYVLPDGRRVFKTEDGTRIFDEHGTEVLDFDPGEIEDERPRWEAFKGTTGELADLQIQREELLAYQTRLDEARARLDAGEITKDELGKLMTGLRKDMPDTVRAHLPEEAAPDRAAEPTAKVDVPAFRPDTAARLDMPTL